MGMYRVGGWVGGEGGGERERESNSRCDAVDKFDCRAAGVDHAVRHDVLRWPDSNAIGNAREEGPPRGGHRQRKPSSDVPGSTLNPVKSSQL